MSDESAVLGAAVCAVRGHAVEHDAGLAGEVSQFLPPPAGYYWIRLFPDSEWQPAYTDGEWWIIGEEGSFLEVVEVGPRIEPPE